jgi:hypothetical protein
MGGNALNKVIASRINLEQYEKIKKDLESKLNQFIQLEFTIDVPGKVDFGDIDILYMFKNNNDNQDIKRDNQDIKQDNQDIVKLIEQIYSPIEIVPNGPVCSFAYYLDTIDKYFQVDLIKVNNLPMSRFYFSYGDLGGIIGRITQHKCITFGSDGLRISPNQETISKFLSLGKLKLDLQITQEQITQSILPNIILTNKPDEICTFIDLDWNKWVGGFDSKQEIFEWIRNSKWFNLDSFRALNCEHRRRANSRPMYQEFLKFIFADEPEFTIEKSNSLKYVNMQLESLDWFGKTHILVEEILEVQVRLLRKNKFSGKKFLDLGIGSKQIKKYLEDFKSYVESESKTNFEIWLDTNEPELIDKTIGEFLNIQNKIKV